MSSSPPSVVVVGGGFGGLNAARALARRGASVTLIDRRNFHLFQPLLYQVATGGLGPADIAAPLRSVFRRQKNVRVLKGNVDDLDLEARQVVVGGERIPYDFLVLAPGATHHYFGHDEWEDLAPGLKTVEDAAHVRSSLLDAFERAERESDPERRRALLTFVIVGGGPTGVELAGAIGELARTTLPSEFRSVDTRRARILLIEAAERLLLAYPEELARRAAQALEELGVTVWCGVKVTGIEPGAVTVDRGGAIERIPAESIVWAAGVKASSLGAILAAQSGAALDRAGRVLVAPDLSVPGRPEVFVIGDLAAVSQDGTMLPGIAPVAIQEGRHVARVIEARIHGRSAPPFRYLDRGSLAVIGRARAVALLWGRRVWGYPAWLLWLFVHLLYLVNFENRLIVLIQWAWNYFTRNRRARIITGWPDRADRANRAGRPG